MKSHILGLKPVITKYNQGGPVSTSGKGSWASSFKQCRDIQI